MFIIDFLYSLIGTPLGYIMWVCYLCVNNFGWAIILFTIIVKAAMFPLTLKQQKNMAISQLYTPRVQEIQNKYKNNKEKQQEELAKLQKDGYNPMGGCLPMLLTMLLLFGVIDVVYKPMTHMEHFEWVQSGSISQVVNIAREAEIANIILASDEDKAVVLEYKKEPGKLIVSEKSPQIVKPETFKMEESKLAVKTITPEMRTQFGTFTDDQLKLMTDKSSRLSDPVKLAINDARSRYAMLQKELFAVQAYDKHPEAFQNNVVVPEIFEKLDKLNKNMRFMGMDLGKTPTFAFDPLIIIPILSFVLSLLQTIITQKLQKITNPELQKQQNGCMNGMLYMMPLFSLYIAFVVPAGVGFYWAISYLVGIAQSFIMFKFWPNNKLAAEAAEKLKAKSKNTPIVTTVVTKTDKQGNKVDSVEQVTDLSQKDIRELNRRKLEEARRLDAEKYGEDYTDDSDDKK